MPRAKQSRKHSKPDCQDLDTPDRGATCSQVSLGLGQAIVPWRLVDHVDNVQHQLVLRERAKNISLDTVRDNMCRLPQELVTKIIDMVGKGSLYWSRTNIVRGLIIAHAFKDTTAIKHLVDPKGCLVQMNGVPRPLDNSSVLLGIATELLKRNEYELIKYLADQFPYRAKYGLDNKAHWFSAIVEQNRVSPGTSNMEIIQWCFSPDILVQNRTFDWSNLTLLPVHLRQTMVSFVLDNPNVHHHVPNRSRFMGCIPLPAIQQLYTSTVYFRRYCRKVSVRKFLFRAGSIKKVFLHLGALDDVALCDWWISTFGRQAFDKPGKLQFEFKSDAMRKWYKDNGFV